MRTVSRGNVVSRRQFNAIALKTAALPLAAGLVANALPAGAAPLPQQTATPDASPEASPVPMTTATPEVDWSNGVEEIWRYQPDESVSSVFNVGSGTIIAVTKIGSDTLDVFDRNTLEHLWSYRSASSTLRWVTTEPAVYVADATVIIAMDPQSGDVLWTFDPGADCSQSGDVLWTFDPGADWTFDSRNSYDGDNSDIVFFTTPSKLFAIRRDTGSVAVSVGVLSNVSWSIRGANLVLFDGDALRSFNLDSGEEIWRNPGYSTLKSRFISDETLYLLMDNDVRAIQLIDGTERWRSSEPFPEQHNPNNATFFTVSGSAIITQIGQQFTGLDAATGSAGWTMQIKDGSVECWKIGKKTIMIMGDTSIAMIDSSSGEIIWGSQGSKPEYITSIIHAQIYIDPRFYLLIERSIHCIDSDTGRINWNSEEIPSTEMKLWSFQDWLQTVHVQSGEDIVFIDKATGGINQTLPVPSNADWNKDAENFYVLTESQLVALDPNSGKQRWETDVDPDLSFAGQSFFSPASGILLGRSGTTLTGIDPSSGNVWWRVVTETPIEFVTRDQAVIFVQDDRGTYYAFVPKALQLESGGSAVTMREVTLRGAPNAKSVERATLPKGTTVTITGESETNGGETWWPVDTGKPGGQGWLPAESLEPTANAPAT